MTCGAERRRSPSGQGRGDRHHRVTHIMIPIVQTLQNAPGDEILRLTGLSLRSRPGNHDGLDRLSVATAWDRPPAGPPLTSEAPFPRRRFEPQEEAIGG